MTVTNPDEKERPIITAISDFASNLDTFYITQVREEYMDVENASEFKKVNGRIARKNNKESINLRFDGERRYTLQEVFIKYLYTLQETDFTKSSAIDIADYYILNRPLRDDRLSKEEKAELKANAREEGERLFSNFLHEVLTFDDQQRLDYSWNRLYNAQADIKHHGEVLYVAFEEGYGYTLKEKITRIGAIHPRLHFSEELPGKLGSYDFVFIDSVSRAGMELEDMIELKNKYPRTSFIFIFHATKDGKFKGGNELAHEVDVIIEVENGMARGKGRFGNGEVEVRFWTNN